MYLTVYFALTNYKQGQNQFVISSAVDLVVFQAIQYVDNICCQCQEDP